MVKTKAKVTRRRVVHHHEELPFLSNGMSTIAIGAAAGCVIGAAAALLLAPKPKRHRFTQGLDNIYDHISDTAQGYASGAYEKGQTAFQGAKESAENLCSAACDVLAGGGKNRNLVLGILGAGLLGASAIYMMSQKSSDSLSERWGASKWSDMAKFVVDVVSDKLQGEEAHHHGGHNPINHVLDWAMTGLNLWQEIKKRR